MCTWSVTATVRQRGAIGVFYPAIFAVDLPSDATPEQLHEAWFEKYGGAWELNHFDEIKRDEPATA